MTSYASAFEIEQKVNRCHRRCKIGKVSWKHRVDNPKIELQTHPFAPLSILPFTVPGMVGTKPWWEYPPYNSSKCSCEPGTVCMNAACPHLPIVTC